MNIGAKAGRKNVENLHGTILYLQSSPGSSLQSQSAHDQDGFGSKGLTLTSSSLLPSQPQRKSENFSLEHSPFAVRLEKVIGKGTYSVVYRAVTPRSEYPQVAIKCLSTKDMSKTQKKRQNQECQMLRELNASEIVSHRVVKLIQEYEGDSITYLIFELAQTNLFNYLIGTEGLTLGDSDISAAEAERFFLEILEGLHGCHQLNIFHRDIKPENLLLDRAGRSYPLHVKIADFGLATRQSRSNEFGCGSLRYMSVECLNHDRKALTYDCAKNDAWSAAIVLINMLTKKNPWNSPAVTDSHFREHVLDYSQQNKTHGHDKLVMVFEFSEELARILRKVFCREADRVTVDELASLVLGLNLNFFSENHIRVLAPEHDHTSTIASVSPLTS